MHWQANGKANAFACGKWRMHLPFALANGKACGECVAFAMLSSNPLPYPRHKNIIKGLGKMMSLLAAIFIILRGWVK